MWIEFSLLQLWTLVPCHFAAIPWEKSGSVFSIASICTKSSIKSSLCLQILIPKSHSTHGTSAEAIFSIPQPPHAPHCMHSINLILRSANLHSGLQMRSHQCWRRVEDKTVFLICWLHTSYPSVRWPYPLQENSHAGQWLQLVLRLSPCKSVNSQLTRWRLNSWLKKNHHFFHELWKKIYQEEWAESFLYSLNLVRWYPGWDTWSRSWEIQAAWRYFCSLCTQGEMQQNNSALVRLERLVAPHFTQTWVAIPLPQIQSAKN